MLLKIVDFPKKELRNDKSFYALSNIKKLNKFQPKKKNLFVLHIEYSISKYHFDISIETKYVVYLTYSNLKKKIFISFVIFQK